MTEYLKHRYSKRVWKVEIDHGQTIPTSPTSPT